MRTIRGWRKGRARLEQWRRNLTTVSVTLKSPRAIDVTPVDFISGEPLAGRGQAKKKFTGKLIHFTPDDATVRRPSGALLVIDTYEIASLAAGGTRILP